MLDSVKSSSTRMMLRAQHYFFFPILLFARISWCQQSVMHASDLTKVGTWRAGALEVETLKCILSGMPSRGEETVVKGVW